MRDFKTEPHVVINDDRTVTVPKELRKIAVQFDHNIETVIFDCPRYWDGHDLSELKIYINYIRVDMYRDRDVADNIKVDGADSNLIHFEWTLTRNVTLMKGKIRFLICAVETDSDGNELRHWNSELNEEMHVSEGLEVGDFIHDLHSDVITDLLTRMDKILVANTPILDKTLTERGLAADAKATGDRIDEVVQNLNDSALSLSNTINENEEALSRAISAESLARKAEIDVERKRINKLTSLKSGSTTGDAELIDGRIDVDGKVYDNIGEAIRGQIKGIRNLTSVNPAFEQGTISSTTGMNTENVLNRIRTGYLQADNFLSAVVDSTFIIALFQYDGDFAFLSTSGWVNSLDCSMLLEECQFIRIAVARRNAENITPDVETGFVMRSVGSLIRPARTDTFLPFPAEGKNAALPRHIPLRASPRYRSRCFCAPRTSAQHPPYTRHRIA